MCWGFFVQFFPWQSTQMFHNRESHTSQRSGTIYCLTITQPRGLTGFLIVPEKSVIMRLPLFFHMSLTSMSIDADGLKRIDPFFGESLSKTLDLQRHRHRPATRVATVWVVMHSFTHECSVSTHSGPGTKLQKIKQIKISPLKNSYSVRFMKSL